jgi:catechol 2,3-dioxygenase
MRIGYVSLNVSNLQRSIEFYQSVLGFKAAEKSGERALLSAGGQHLVELLQAKNNNTENVKRAGLYHFAILLPERKFLADMLGNLDEKRASVHFEGLADHLVSESIYIHDLDHNGIEIYCDRPSSGWVWEGGRVRMATERLDIQDLLKERTDQGWREMPARTVIGHVHLHVSDLEKASAFYSEMLGLSMTATLPGACFFAADRYHHHVATNTWLGAGVAPAATEKVGLNHFGIVLPSSEQEDMAARLESRGMEGGPASLHDPDGIAIQLHFRKQLQ